MRTWAALVVFALCTLAGEAWPHVARAENVRLSMSASSSRVQAGEPFAVEIRAELSGVDDDDTEIDLPEFEAFEVLGRRVSRPFSFSFGFGSGGQQARVQSELIYSFTLRAPAAGRFVIQPAVITVNGRKYASRPLTIEVSGSAQPSDPNAGAGALPGMLQSQPGANTAPPSGSLDGAQYDPELFVRTVVDRRRAYVGEQVTVTIYLYVRGGLRDTPTVSREATNEGFWVQDLLPTQRSLSAVRQEVNGRVFSAYVLRRYAAFPMRAGKLEIGAPSVEVSAGGSLFDLLSGPSAPVRRNGVPVSIEVGELPARANGKLPAHVGTLSLEASLDPAAAKVGDAVTLRVSAKGYGNLRALKLAAPSLPGLEVLPPEIDDKVSTDLDQVGGERVFRWLILPRQPGTHTIPAFRVDVLDPKLGTYATVSSSELRLEVTGQALATPDAAAAGPAKPAAQPPTEAEPRPSLGPLRTQSELRRALPPLASAAWFFWAVAAGPLCLLVGLGGVWTRRELARRRQLRRGSEQGTKLAAGHLQRARTAVAGGDAQTALSALGQSLKGALEARLGEPIGGFTRGALRTHLNRVGMASPLADRLLGELEQLDQARFAPTPKGAQELSILVERTAASLHELERFTPRRLS